MKKVYYAQFGAQQDRQCKIFRSLMLSIHYTRHKPRRVETSRATSRAIGLVARLVLICHFQIFGLACGLARVVCGVKIARAEPAVSFVYRVICLLWHLELHKTSYFNTFSRIHLESLANIRIVSQNFVQ